MARAVIHNSDYQSIEKAKAAIDRYFLERNDYFTSHPSGQDGRFGAKSVSSASFRKRTTAKTLSGAVDLEDYLPRTVTA
jgi:hypothetical protein